jgi:hypothetical protein
MKNNYSSNGISKFVLRHNLTGLYFTTGRGFSASIADAARIGESEMTATVVVVGYTWGKNFAAIQVGN